MAKLWTGHEKKTLIITLTSKCVLDIAATDLGLARDTLSYDGQNFGQVISKSILER